MKKKTRPLIGITSSMVDDRTIKMNQNYFSAVYEAGGMPVFLPYTLGAERAKEIHSEFDGFLFAGGVDIDPKYYGEEITGDGVEVCAPRDEFELALLEELKESPKPILGICRGIQVMNVACGGTLIQDMDGHRQSEPRECRPQSVNLAPDSLLLRLAGDERISVNSFHHQAIKDASPWYKVTACADDGTVEAIELKRPMGRFALGVQWHPEMLYETDRVSRAIFDAFIQAARKQNPEE